MKNNFFDEQFLVKKLYETQNLDDGELKLLIESKNNSTIELLKKKACEVRRQNYGNKVFLRGLIEISNYCKNNCFYCGIRSQNKDVLRYRLFPEQIIECCELGHSLGIKTFVLQGGEDSYFTDEILCPLINQIKQNFSDCAVTLSLGERSFKSYENLRKAGADRYLLRQEACDKELYSKLHPKTMSIENRKQCLFELKKLGFQTGAGFMVGAPFQTTNNLISDIRFMQELSPQMIGIGPFIPHHKTPFYAKPAGTSEQTLKLLAIIRLMFPKILLPSTTALATILQDNHKSGLSFGCNVIMPNLSPKDVRKKYDLYDNKAFTKTESAEGIQKLTQEIHKIGLEVSSERGDYIE